MQLHQPPQAPPAPREQTSQVPQAPIPQPVAPSVPAPSPSNGTTKPTPPPVIKTEDKTLLAREPREKKDSWKKKEAKESTRKPTILEPPTSTLFPLRLRPPPYRQQDFNATPRLPTFTFSHTATLSDGTSVDLHRISDQPFNKKKFRYTPCAATPSMPQIMYRQIELPPYCARVNWQDMNPYIMIDKEGLTMSTEKGYRMARTNVCIREGEWYVEFKIERGGGDQGGHTRVGFSRRESISFLIPC
jgi:COMPASS component BRE2